MVTLTMTGAQALTAWGVLGQVSRVDDATMDGIMEARTLLEKACLYTKRRWPFPVLDAGTPRERYDLDAAEDVTASIAVESETLSAVLAGLISLAERAKKDGEVSGQPAQSVAEIYSVAESFRIRSALRKRLRGRGEALHALSEPLDDEDEVLQVDANA